MWCVEMLNKMVCVRCVSLGKWDPHYERAWEAGRVMCPWLVDDVLSVLRGASMPILPLNIEVTYLRPSDGHKAGEIKIVQTGTKIDELPPPQCPYAAEHVVSEEC